jgi:rhamnogalacturonyl hydrolase YesR
MKTLAAPLISDAEENFCFYKLGMAGSGMSALIEAIFKLDMPNRFKMAKGFPELVEVVNRYNNETGYWRDLVDRWNSDSHLKLQY